MRRAAAARGVELLSHARQARRQDFIDFNLILAMDRENYADLLRIGGGVDDGAKLQLFCELCDEHDEEEVPDPYYGGDDGFEHVLDILEDGCGNLLASLER